jgi:hypothetical protein
VADDVARDSPRRSMYQVIQVTVHTTKRRWRVKNRRRLRIRQRPGVGLFAGPHFFIACPSFFCAATSLLLYRIFQSPSWGFCPADVCTASTCTCLDWATRFWWRGREDHREAAAAYRPAKSIEQVKLFSPSSGGASLSCLPLITYGRRSGSKQVGAGGLVL